MNSDFDLIDAFSHRPFLTPLTRAALKAALVEQFPAVDIDPDVAAIIATDSPDEAVTLTQALRTHFATGKTLRWTTGQHRLVADPAVAAPVSLEVDVEQLAVLVDSVCLGIADIFTEALIVFWDRPDASGLRPGQRLADAFERRLSGQTGLTQAARRAIAERKALKVLKAQLAAIQRLPSSELGHFEEIERYLAMVTDITPLVQDRQAATRAPSIDRLEQLPSWLSAASSADRLDYSRQLAAVAVAARNAAGKAWDDELPSLLDYARMVLQQAMCTDHPQAKWMTLDDVTVHVAKVVASPVPSTGQIIAVGDIERRQMSVAQFALGNLCSIPSGTVSLTVRDGGPLPGWLTVAYVRQLIVRVDIGGAYPALVRRCLMTDPAQSARRKTLFADQLRVQLPLKALEQKIRGEGGLTDAGYRCVCGVMQASDTLYALRPLAWISQPGAASDEVCNMFIIGATDTTLGPFILYRPFASTPLTEFPTWLALRNAIATAGELRDEVLVWMTDQGRQRYANGGFEQSHILRFGIGSDFAPLETPDAPQLSVVPVEGDRMQALFTANAKALVDLADRQSVSNAESRWAMLQRGGWLALDVVMPFLSGPTATALWLIQLMIAVDRVVVAERRGAGGEGAQAWSSLLLTLSMILLHQGFKPVVVGTIKSATVEPVLQVQEGATDIAVTAEVETESFPQWDFSWSSLSHRLNESQLQALERLKLSPEPNLDAPSTEPGREGLWRHGQQWCVRLDSGVYEVGFSGDQVFIVNPHHPQVSGPRLRRTGQAWALDLSLGLCGGGPKRNARQLAQENAATLKRVTERDAVLEQNKAALYKKFVGWDATQKSVSGQVPARIYDLIEKDLDELKAVYEERYQLQQSLRPADRLSDKVLACDLQRLVRRIAFLEGVLLHNAVRLTQATLPALNAESAGVVSTRNVSAYLGLFEDLLKLQDRAVRWSIEREALWQRLRAVPRVGEGLWREEVLELQNSNLYTSLAWRIDRMWSLLELSFTAQDILSGLGDQAFKGLRTDDSLHAAFSSQAELEKPNDYTLAEQIDVLESSLREYRRCTLIASCAKERALSTLSVAPYERFLDDLAWIVERAETRLSDLVRESAEPAEHPVEYTPRVKQPRKRIIKTRGHRTLVGRLREGEPELAGAVVDVTKTMSDTVVGTYHQHENGEWVEVEVRPAIAPSTAPASVALSELKRQANAALDQVERDITMARAQSRRTYEPSDIQDILLQKAQTLTILADKLAPHLVVSESGLSGPEAVLTLVDRLRSEASKLTAEGRALRIAMIKAQPPTASRLDYLASEQEVDIARFEGRKNMSGGKRNDFLQEYVIRDKDQRVLWWAHFHYASEAAADTAFTAAHLKLPDQRFVGYTAQVKAARANKEVVNIYRSYIGKDIAQRRFLDMAPGPARDE